jgi:hypothetical protein
MKTEIEFLTDLKNYCEATKAMVGISILDDFNSVIKRRLLELNTPSTNSPESPSVEKPLETMDYEPTNGVVDKGYPYSHNSSNSGTHQDSYSTKGDKLK